jgi:metal-responsive CopG/Arc/MetJ family transcriptional regulator
MKEMMRTHVLIPQDLMEKVDRLVGPRRRSEFLSQALREKLSRVELAEAARKAAGSLADVPGWESRERARAWVEALRKEDEKRLRRLERRR